MDAKLKKEISDCEKQLDSVRRQIKNFKAPKTEAQKAEYAALLKKEASILRTYVKLLEKSY